MRAFLLFLACCCFGPVVKAQQANDTVFAKHWTATEKKAADTGADSTWMSTDERLVIFYLNLARLYPKKFAQTYVLAARGVSSKTDLPYHAEDLYDELDTSAALRALVPDRQMYAFASCFSKELADDNRFDHQRNRCKNGFFDECCAAGASRPLDIVMMLLVDEGISDNAHRRIMLSADKLVGVSLRSDHPKYGGLAVLDFQ